MVDKLVNDGEQRFNERLLIMGNGRLTVANHLANMVNHGSIAVVTTDVMMKMAREWWLMQ